MRYFFITDRISKGEVQVKWCPTKEIVRDFMTKPLQGLVFKKFHDLIMGSLLMEEARKLVTLDKESQGSGTDGRAPQECVG